MDHDFREVISRLITELGLSASLLNLSDQIFTNSKVQEFIIARKDNAGDYFIFGEIKPNKLDETNRDLQTGLMSYLSFVASESKKNQLKQLNDIALIKLDKNFEKNTSLLLFTVCPSDNEKLIAKILEIEEDEYFFKKQVIRLPTNFCSDIVTKLAEDPTTKLIEYLQQVMNNQNKFDSFVKNSITENLYSGVAQLFEKLPFLHLDIADRESISLQDNINNDIENKVSETSTENQLDDDADKISSETTTQLESVSVKMIMQNTKEIISAALELNDEEVNAKALMLQLQENVDNEQL